MTFKEFLATLAKRWRLILLCFLLVGIGTYAGSRLLTPLYQSSTIIQVAISSPTQNSSLTQQTDLNNLLASNQLVQTEAQIATSDSVMSEVASHYPGLTLKQLAGEVTVTSIVNTQLFEISVEDPQPNRAAALANDFAAALIAQQQQSVQQDNLHSQQQIQQELDHTQEQMNTVTIQITKLQAAGGNGSQISALQLQHSALHQHYNLWLAALEQLKLSETQSNNFLLVIQPARPIPSPVSPRIVLNTGIGLLMGLLLGILLAVVLEQVDTRVRTSEALTQLSGWPVLATLWLARPSKKEAVFYPQGHDANAESYRLLSATIGFSAVDKPLRSLMVTSALFQEGRSTIAANLAIFMAKADKPTLLIDADLYRPRQHTLFGLAKDQLGLSNAIQALDRSIRADAPISHQFSSSYSQLSNTCAMQTDKDANMGELLDAFIHATSIPNLWIMPSGPLPPNASQLFNTMAIQHLLAELKESGIEMIILDAPPLLGLSDATILASKVDGVLVAVDITRSQKRDLKQVKALLTQARAYVTGCIVNKQRRSGLEMTDSFNRDELTSEVDSLIKSINTPHLLNANTATEQHEATHIVEKAKASDVLVESSDTTTDTIKLPRFNRRKAKEVAGDRDTSGV